MSISILSPSLPGSIASPSAASAATAPFTPETLRAHYHALAARLKISPLLTVGRAICGPEGQALFSPCRLDQISGELMIAAYGRWRGESAALELSYLPGRFVTLTRFSPRGNAQLFHESWNWMAGSAEVVAAELEAAAVKQIRRMERWVRRHHNG